MLFYHVQHILARSVPPMANNQDDVHSNAGYISEEEDGSDNDSQDEEQSSSSSEEESISSSDASSSKDDLNLSSNENSVLRLQMIKAIVDSCSFKSPKSDEPRRMQVLDLYCLTRFESKSSSKGIVY